MTLSKLHALELFVFSVVERKRGLGWTRDSLVWQVIHGLPWWELFCLNFVGFLPIILQTISWILQIPVNAKQTWIFFFIVLVIGVQHILQDYFSLLVPISNILLDNLERRRITHQQFSMSLGLQNSSARKRINTRRLWEVFLHTQEIKEQSVKEATLVSVEYMGQCLICQSCNHSLAYWNKQRGTIIRADPYLLRRCCGRTCWNRRKGQKGRKIWSNFK